MVARLPAWWTTTDLPVALGGGGSVSVVLEQLELWHTCVACEEEDLPEWSSFLQLVNLLELKFNKSPLCLILDALRLVSMLSWV